MADDAEPLRSMHTESFPALLGELGVSLLVTTYQAGRLIVLRADGDRLNTHFRTFVKPMGLAAQGDRLLIGTRSELREFRDVPAAGAKRPPPGPVDACYFPRRTHVTGDVDVHELAFGAEGEPWLVNTRFSCLCTIDADSSFVPQWRPPFVSALAPEDRCHLNGLAMQDGRPRYVTVLGTGDEPNGWRPTKAAGGALIDVPSGEIVVAGLSMPHSPRLRGGELWALESGAGRVSKVDLRAGRAEPVAELPGFTRGIDFCGPFAFVGLSQVRESAVFSGIPIARRPERQCGVWVVDLRTGATAGYVQFTDAVQEIFAVQALPGRRFPDLVNDEPDVIGGTYVLPQESLAEVRLRAA